MTLFPNLTTLALDRCEVNSHVVVSTIVLQFPCYSVPAGSTSLTTAAPKRIGLVDVYGNVSYTPILANTYVGSYYSSYGFHQAVTDDGSRFWLAGSSSDNWGFRYVPSRDAGFSVPIQGCREGSLGYDEARSIMIRGTQLFGSGYSTTVQPLTGIYTLAESLSSVSNTSAPCGDNALRLPGFTGSNSTFSPWTFVFASSTELWVASDHIPSARAALVQFIYDVQGSAWAAANEPVQLNPNNPNGPAAYSITGRYEEEQFVVYAATRDSVYKYTTQSQQVSVVAVAAPHTVFQVSHRPFYQHAQVSRKTRSVYYCPLATILIFSFVATRWIPV